MLVVKVALYARLMFIAFIASIAFIALVYTQFRIIYGRITVKGQ